jgi:hypothetical protein
MPFGMPYGVGLLSLSLDKFGRIDHKTTRLHESLNGIACGQTLFIDSCQMHSHSYQRQRSTRRNTPSVIVNVKTIRLI